MEIMVEHRPSWSISCKCWSNNIGPVGLGFRYIFCWFGFFSPYHGWTLLLWLSACIRRHGGGVGVMQSSGPENIIVLVVLVFTLCINFHFNIYFANIHIWGVQNLNIWQRCRSDLFCKCGFCFYNNGSLSSCVYCLSQRCNFFLEKLLVVSVEFLTIIFFIIYIVLKILFCLHGLKNLHLFVLVTLVPCHAFWTCKKY